MFVQIYASDMEDHYSWKLFNNYTYNRVVNSSLGDPFFDLVYFIDNSFNASIYIYLYVYIVNTQDLAYCKVKFLT
ncbi:hypothetical protein RIR_jg18291.t1 [Rhizophagus irregularis DAOM 181602=DAOM 197198]|nr:hypothetical protein RIR_jg18291.t1 [Rhizophagus irregularis DAOM 181602=DAOM 197198]